MSLQILPSVSNTTTQILGSYLKFKGKNLGYLSPIIWKTKFGVLTRISEANFGAKPRLYNIEVPPLGPDPNECNWGVFFSTSIYRNSSGAFLDRSANARRGRSIQARQLFVLQSYYRALAYHFSNVWQFFETVWWKDVSCPIPFRCQTRRTGGLGPPVIC